MLIITIDMSVGMFYFLFRKNFAWRMVSMFKTSVFGRRTFPAHDLWL